MMSVLQPVAILFCGVEYLYNFESEQSEKHFCEIILALDKWCRSRFCLNMKFQLLALVVILFSVACRFVILFCRGHYEKNFCVTTLILGQWFMRRYRLNLFPF